MKIENSFLNQIEPDSMTLEKFLGKADDAASKSSDDLVLGQVSLRVPEVLINCLRREAKSRNLMFSEFMRRIIVSGMEKEGVKL